MVLLMRGLPAEHVICFLDDILIASETMEDHLVHLDQVFTAIGRAGLKLHPGKCAVARDQAVCLGHLLTRDGIHPDPHNIEKVKSWPEPRTRKDVRGFLGLTGYYRQYIKGYAGIAEPLTNLTSKDKEWQWGDAEKTAFLTLREALISPQVVAYPDFNQPFWIKTDASGGSVGYVLTQFHNGQEKVISYGSKKLSKTQQAWSTYDKEYFGLVMGVRANSHYLRHRPFFAVTDHRPLLAWRKQDCSKDVTGRRVRWALELDTYDFQLIYRQGAKHCDADALSRVNHEDEDYATDDDVMAGYEESEGQLCQIGMTDATDFESAVKYTCLSSYLNKLRLEQDADPVLSAVKRCVQTRTLPSRRLDNYYRRCFKMFMLKNGVLFMKKAEPLTDMLVLRAVIPPSLVPEILSDAHGGKLAGHPGHARMLARLDRSVVWKDMSADIRAHIVKCKECDLLKEPKPKLKAPREPIKADKVGDLVILDLLQLPPAPGGYHYCAVFEDVFSRYVNLYKLKNKESLGVVKVVQEMCFSRGIPRKLQTDNGREFDNHALKAVSDILGVERAMSVVYRPQSQGVVERQNRQIIAELQARLQQFGGNWTEHLPFVQYAYNSIPHTKTGESPFRVIFGYEAPLPSFTDVDVDHVNNKSVRDYVRQFQERMKSIHNAVRERTESKSAKEKADYDKNAKTVIFEKGDKVYEKELVRKHKLQPRYKPKPVEVVKRVRSSLGDPGHTYMVQREDGSLHRRNIEQLKPVKVDLRVSEKKQSPKRVTPILYLSEEEDEVFLTAPKRAPAVAVQPPWALGLLGGQVEMPQSSPVISLPTLVDTERDQTSPKTVPPPWEVSTPKLGGEEDVDMEAVSPVSRQSGSTVFASPLASPINQLFTTATRQQQESTSEEYSDGELSQAAVPSLSVEKDLPACQGQKVTEERSDELAVTEGGNAAVNAAAEAAEAAQTQTLAAAVTVAAVSHTGTAATTVSDTAAVATVTVSEASVTNSPGEATSTVATTAPQENPEKNPGVNSSETTPKTTQNLEDDSNTESESDIEDMSFLTSSLSHPQGAELLPNANSIPTGKFSMGAIPKKQKGKNGKKAAKKAKPQVSSCSG